MWPGFGENIRVLEWIFNRVDDNKPCSMVNCVDSPIGVLPTNESINATCVSTYKNIYLNLSKFINFN